MGTKSIERRQRAARGDPENRAAIAVAEATFESIRQCCPVEVTVATEEKTAPGEFAVRTPALGKKTVEGRKLALRGDLEHRAAGGDAVILNSSGVGGPVEVPIESPDQSRERFGAVRAIA